MRLLLVEDDELLAQGLIASLKKEGYAIEHAPTQRQAISFVESGEFELVVLDLGLPDGDGLAVLKALKKTKSQTAVLILTARNSLDDKIAGLDLGADDYLAKPFEPKELFARLRVIGRRFTKQVSSTLSCNDVVLDLASHEVLVSGSTQELPRKEYMLLKALMENSGRVLSKTQLESKLYDWGEALGSNAIEVHIHHLRKKMPDGFIKTLRGIGYVVGKGA
ncbi:MULTISPECIES: response regulator [Pseudoalteromonas]|uniref:Response regulator n=1 Tax=Pseudoalteromonas maricaloris TaxID=184924 RepID=A0A8I2H4S3_9GAMM|nr:MULTISPECIES: response regulator [Pseudoalteromonas]KID33740.1 XRE family transcriptional regulator [Pseudoalteromonas flavipulchra NCIMB 2033 = ATCC BAA-314]MBD0782104.1 response regulator [Pseudoalteromonas flavipulchra]MBE0375819.1 two-component system, OmpR family, response regulator [Pseudoalteromonas flavipulchra NCIMB 2033 = ATCC BAA-314]NLR21069.1 response regulator [Pseudoalteromonas maricaloris]ODB36674.1 DNA-binding response regulator [Pseudoalteromonas sp. BMB]